jgi:flagellar assembly protein FliH
MTKVFKVYQHTPRSLIDYDRQTLEELVPRLSSLSRGRADDATEVTPEMILEAAREEAAAKVRDAHAEGYRRGAESGLAEFHAAVGDAAGVLAKAAQAMRDAHEAFLASLEPHVVELALKIVQRLLQREVQTDSVLILKTVREAIRLLADQGQLTIRVNPRDLEVLRGHKVALLDEFEGVHQIRIESDPSLTRGGCVVDSDLMQADATIETQFQQIFDALTAPVYKAEEES